MSVNGKRTAIALNDLAVLAEQYTVKNFRKIVYGVQDAIPYWEKAARELEIPGRLISAMKKNFVTFL